MHGINPMAGSSGALTRTCAQNTAIVIAVTSGLAPTSHSCELDVQCYREHLIISESNITIQPAVCWMSIRRAFNKQSRGSIFHLNRLVDALPFYLPVHVVDPAVYASQRACTLKTPGGSNIIP
jgi:hypothetical protein